MSANLTVEAGGDRAERARKVHSCAICRNKDYWNSRWRWYGSYMMEETCPEYLPRLCSDECQEEFERRLKSGRIRLPKLSEGWTPRVLRPPRGYYTSAGVPLEGAEP